MKYIIRKKLIQKNKRLLCSLNSIYLPFFPEQLSFRRVLLNLRFLIRRQEFFYFYDNQKLHLTDLRYSFFEDNIHNTLEN